MRKGIRKRGLYGVIRYRQQEAEAIPFAFRPQGTKTKGKERALGTKEKTCRRKAGGTRGDGWRQAAGRCFPPRG